MHLMTFIFNFYKNVKEKIILIQIIMIFLLRNYILVIKKLIAKSLIILLIKMMKSLSFELK